MSEYVIQERDFIIRTKALIEQYDHFQIENDVKYEVTLLLNCLVGLLILPQQQHIVNLPDVIIIHEEWGITIQDIAHIEGNPNSVRDIARHMRNSIAHYHFEAFGDANANIDQIRFRDYNRNHDLTFEATLSLEKIRIFITNLSDAFLAQMPPL
jgi:hypothetical protein